MASHSSASILPAPVVVTNDLVRASLLVELQTMGSKEL